MVDESKIVQAIELAKSTGKIKIGTNEATKAAERGVAKLVIIADDVNPKEVVMHLPPLCDEKKITCVNISSKEALGRAAGIKVGTAAIAIIEEGDSKKTIEEIKKG